MNLLALDLATKTGWATLIDGEIDSGVWDFSSDGHKGMRALHCWHDLDTTLRTTTFEQIWYEKPFRHMSNQAAHMFGWWEGLMYMALANNGQPEPIQAAPTEIKKFIAGKGTAKKNDVIAAVEKLGYKPQDDNESDALALLLMAMSRLDNSQYDDATLNNLPF